MVKKIKPFFQNFPKENFASGTISTTFKIVGQKVVLIGPPVHKIKKGSKNIRDHLTLAFLTLYNMSVCDSRSISSAVTNGNSVLPL